MVYEDPETFVTPWKVVWALFHAPAGMMESLCNENNKFPQLQGDRIPERSCTAPNPFRFTKRLRAAFPLVISQPLGADRGQLQRCSFKHLASHEGDPDHRGNNHRNPREIHHAHEGNDCSATDPPTAAR